MKNHFTFLFFLLCTSIVFAQEADKSPEFKNEWGLNITGFANQFLSFNGNNANPGSYLFTYKHIQGEQAFRMGLGLFLSNVKSDGNNNSADLETKGGSISLRLGLEKQHSVGHRWLFTAGGDFLIGYTNTTSESPSNFGNVSLKNNEWAVGIGPVLGIHYRINQRVSVGSEGTIYLNYFNSKSESDFGFNNGSDSDKSSGVNLIMNTPLALYFAIRI